MRQIRRAVSRLPIAYLLGAADSGDAEVFNDICNLDSIAMTGFIFGA